jgi:hypothetical protein
MELYNKRYGSSHISSFKIGIDFIDVKFNDSKTIYRYSYSNAGKEHVERMKRFAVAGKWLNHYIRYFVMDSFDK